MSKSYNYHEVRIREEDVQEMLMNIGGAIESCAMSSGRMTTN